MKINNHGKINAEWHRQHRMPKNATIAQRITWHRQHAKHCACRPIPLKLLHLISKESLSDSRG